MKHRASFTVPLWANPPGCPRLRRRHPRRSRNTVFFFGLNAYVRDLGFHLATHSLGYLCVECCQHHHHHHHHHHQQHQLKP